VRVDIWRLLVFVPGLIAVWRRERGLVNLTTPNRIVGIVSSAIGAFFHVLPQGRLTFKAQSGPRATSAAM